MVYIPLLLSALALQASAFPNVLNTVLNGNVQERQSVPGAGSPAAKAISRARGNCGVVPCLTFDAEEQFVSTSGEFAYASPAASEIRGPCPGLNAAANHGYLPRNGIATIQDTVIGLAAAYGMSPELAAFLATVAIVLDGDPVRGTWSIGGPPPSNPLTDGIFGQPQGISYSHNNYEGDASIGRADAYLNNGDAHSLIPSRFDSAYAAMDDNNLYTLDRFARNYGQKAKESIRNNPYAFFGPFSGLVAPAAYNFVINFMSNHTAENPNGYLDGKQFKTFFAITGQPGNFKWKKGQERIPDNWYRRPSSNQYNAANVIDDLGVQFLAYPNTFYLGGNTGKKNSFTGFDFGNLTNGVFNADTLLEGNNLGCFFFQSVQAGLPDAADIGLKRLAAINRLLRQNLQPIVSRLNCPQLGKYDQTFFNQFPGYKYQPRGPATNYKA